MTSTTQLSELLDFTKQLAFDAGKLMINARKEANFKLNLKKKNDLLTSADIEIDEFISQTIENKYPTHRILSEESSPDLEIKDATGPLWVIDPIDGTTNFYHGHIYSATSIALLLNNRLSVGVVHCPFSNDTFWATAGGGAFRNGDPIAVTSTDNLQSALVGTGFPYERGKNLDLVVKRIKRVLEKCRDIRRLGAASLDICFVACGCLDAFYENLAPWDIAAGKLIAREAGATIGHYSEETPNTTIEQELFAKDLIVSTPGIYSDFKNLLTSWEGRASLG